MSTTSSPSSTPTATRSLSIESAASKNASPLNAHAIATPPTAKSSLIPLPEDDDDHHNTQSSSPQLRGRTLAAAAAAAVAGGGISYLDAGSSSSSLPILGVDEMRSTARERSRSAGRSIQDAEANLKSSWWTEKHVSRPWQDNPKRKQSVPKEQTEAIQNTRTKVAQAVASALDVGSDIIHEALFLGVDLLQLAPIPGLSEAAKTLLNIWDAVQQVDMYRLACLRLTERCADILLSVRHEVHEAGNVVDEELAAPIEKLEKSYLSVHRFMLRQIQRPWLKRYLKRGETLTEISDCDNLLRDALSLFGVAIQIRTLRLVQESEKRRQAEFQALASSILRGSSNPDRNLILGPETAAEPEAIDLSRSTFEYSTRNALGLISDGDVIHSTSPTITNNTIPPSRVMPVIQSIQEAQNLLDAALDTADLRQIMHTTLQTGSDAGILDVLQVKRNEMPDAIKTLQRALSRLSERDGGAEKQMEKSVVLGKVVRTPSVKNLDGSMAPKRTSTIISIESSSSEDSGSGSSSEVRRRDTLDWEFMETGIDALWRMSHGVATTVPSWTITKYEVDRDEKIGVGFFSDVYKGTWRGRSVAIKVLAETTPRTLFVREIGIWKTLKHSNVLQLYGASSATGDPPWFFVSPYMKNGNLAAYLRQIEAEMHPPGLGVGHHQSLPVTPSRGVGFRSTTLPNTPRDGSAHHLGSVSSPGLVVPSMSRSPSRENKHVQREWDLFRLMHEIAKGMSYLHSKGVLHGDLKAANVLVDDKSRCVISDFGQSEMKSEAYRISGTPPRGTLRWQSPERMSGKTQLTIADDVWAFSICCVEILNMGRMPWSLMDDNTVRHFVLKDGDNSRPSVPRNSKFNTPGLQEILRSCWSTNPVQRPTFQKVSRGLKLLRKSFGQDFYDSPALPTIQDVPEPIHTPSPDLYPQANIPPFVQNMAGPIPNEVLDSSLVPAITSSDNSHRESTVINEEGGVSQPVIFTPAENSSRASSVVFQHEEEEEEEDPITVINLDGYESPPPVDERIALIKNERRYRLLLTHDYHPSLTLPLWNPTPTTLGAVGYLSKPKGEFITLFSAYSPDKASHPLIQKLPSIEGYGHAGRAELRQDRRTVAQKALDLIGGNLSFGSSSKQLSRRYSFPLKAGHKVAYLCTEITQYEYMASLDAPRRWFQLHVDDVMKAYGRDHRIQKEDLVLVIGALRVPNYGLFVSHSHSEGHVHFSVYTSQKNGQLWGTFTTDADVTPGSGPSYFGEADVPCISASKVSRHGELWTSVLLARLRFKPDAVDPTTK